jgi:hypothetical protein
MSRYDDEHGDEPGRTFAALLPARGRGFARSRWGRAWLRALEDAALDEAAVKAGRRLARAGGVGAVTVRPGRVTAVVRDRDGVTHRVDVLVPELSDEEWGRFLDVTVRQAGHMAALLDGELPPLLVEDAAVGGVAAAGPGRPGARVRLRGVGPLRAHRRAVSPGGAAAG